MIETDLFLEWFIVTSFKIFTPSSLLQHEQVYVL